MLRFLLPLFALLLFLSACTDDPQPGGILRRLAPPAQVFHLKTGRDTSITCQNGTVLRFCGNTFQTTAESVTLEIREVLNRADMIRNGLSTITSDGRLLESEGMFYLKVTSPGGTSINPECPVQVKLPARGLKAEAILFTGRSGEHGIIWENPRNVSNAEELYTLDRGRNLFCTHCAACHDDSLSNDLTGPALGNIRERRQEKWLIAYTRNSYQMVAGGDPQALCLWDNWKPAVMPQFAFLSDEEIKAIYAFIEAESARQGAEQPNRESSCLPKRGEHAAERLAMASTYFFPVTNDGWVNVDYFWREEPAPVPFLVEIESAERYADVLVALTFDRRKANMFLEKVGADFGFLGKPEAPLPQEPVHIYALAFRKNRFYAASLSTTLTANNRFRLKLEDIPERTLQEVFKAVEPPVMEPVNWCDRGMHLGGM